LNPIQCQGLQYLHPNAALRNFSDAMMEQWDELMSIVE
jgi:hypothetical protein